LVALSAPVCQTSSPEHTRYTEHTKPLDLSLTNSNTMSNTKMRACKSNNYPAPPSGESLPMARNSPRPHRVNSFTCPGIAYPDIQTTYDHHNPPQSPPNLPSLNYKDPFATMSSLSTRVIAITGASGIGLATAHLLASHGAALSLADLNASALEKTEKDIKSKYPDTKILTFPLDVRTESAVAAWIAKTVEVLGGLHGAANLAGVIGESIGVKGVEEQDVDEWDFVLGVNLKGVMLCLKHELKVMREGASVVNASSIAGVVGM